MPHTKTTYQVDLTVDPITTVQASGAANKPSAMMESKKAVDTTNRQQQQQQQQTAYTVQSGAQTIEDTLQPAKIKKNKQDKKAKQNKNKHSIQASESSSSSSSSDSSDDDCSDTEYYLGNKGTSTAFQQWRYQLYTPSASYRQLDMLSGSHYYTVSGFSLARAVGYGSRLCSDFFEVAGQLFRLEVYPAGFSADTRKHLSVFLTTPGSANPNHIMYDIAVLDQSGKEKHIVATSKANRRYMCSPMLAHTRGVVGAVLKLAKFKDLQEKPKRYLPHDTLVLRATVHVLRGWSSIPTTHLHTATAAAGPGGLPYCSPSHPTSMHTITMPGLGLPYASPQAPGMPMPTYAPMPGAHLGCKPMFYSPQRQPAPAYAMQSAAGSPTVAAYHPNQCQPTVPVSPVHAQQAQVQGSMPPPSPVQVVL